LYFENPNIMNNLPITVLMPVYNAAPFLAEAIESILNQTYTDFEFLIINDGSTDSSQSIIESYNDKRIRLVNNETNIKLIATLNKGIALAQGKYIVRMDADDISLPNRLEKQISFMETNPEIGLCGSFIRTTGLENNYDVHFSTTHAEIKFKLFFDTHFPHPAAVIRKSVLEKHQLFFKKEYIHAEDFALWNAMAEVTRLAIIPEILVLKRSHDEQISFKYNHIQSEISSKIRIELMRKMGLHPQDSEIKLYDAFLAKEFPQNKNDLFVLLDFFNKLILANKKSGVYEKEFFETYFAQEYWNLCCNNTKYGKNLYYNFIKSEAFFILNLSWSLKKKFYLKTLLQYGK